jgi:CRISPR-associated protein Cas2
MKKFDYIVCYDISNPKRLAKVAKKLLNVSIRIQKSVYFCPDMGTIELEYLIDSITSIIDKDQDDIRVYKIDKAKSIHLNSAVDLMYPNIL